MDCCKCRNILTLFLMLSSTPTLLATRIAGKNKHVQRAPPGPPGVEVGAVAVPDDVLGRPTPFIPVLRPPGAPPIIPDPPTEEDVVEEIQKPPHSSPLAPQLPAETVVIGSNGISKSKRYLASYNRPYYPGPEDWPKVYRYFYRHYNHSPVEVIQRPVEEFLPPVEEPTFVVVKERHAGGYFG